MIQLSKKLFYALLTLLVLSLFFFFSYKSKEDNNSQSQEQNADNTLDTIGGTSKPPQFYKRVARELAHHLGTAYGWWNPRGWSENDQEAYNLLVTLSREDIRVISILYNETYTEGNNLHADVIRLLPPELYNKLENL